MSLELVRESTKVNYVVGEELAQTIVEHDIIVPDVNPDVARILLIDGEIREGDSEASQDRIHVDGTIYYKILYVSDDPEQSVKSINTSSDFSYTVDVANSRAGMKAKVKCDIEHIDYEILNGRKINAKTILRIYAKAVNDVEQEFVSDLRGIEDIQVLKDNVDIYCYLGENTVNCTSEEMLEVPAGKPAIKEILRNDVKIVGKDYRISDDKIIAKGDINILTLYIGDNEERSIQFMEHEISFTQFIDLPGISESSECEVDYRIKNATFIPQEDSDGELRILKAEVTVGLMAEATDKKNVEIVSDAYGLRSNIENERQAFKINRVVARNRSQVTLKEVVEFDGNSPDISEVFNVLCKPGLLECSAGDGYVNVEGIVKNNILYVANNTEQPVFAYSYEMPFSQRIELEGAKPGMRCDVDLEVDHYSYSVISANEVELRVVVDINARLMEQTDVSLITNVTETPAEDRSNEQYPSITIYFSQPGDTLWKIAKKYRTTVEDILRVNEFGADDVIGVGQQIIVPRKIS